MKEFIQEMKEDYFREWELTVEHLAECAVEGYLTYTPEEALEIAPDCRKVWEHARDEVEACFDRYGRPVTSKKVLKAAKTRFWVAQKAMVYIIDRMLDGFIEIPESITQGVSMDIWDNCERVSLGA